MRDGMFNAATDSDGFNLANHNDTDFERFRAFQSRIDARYDSLEKSRDRKTRAANLAKWDSMLPYPWNQAKLGQLKDRSAVDQVTSRMAPDRMYSFYIKGGEGSGKTFLALAIARRYIGMGLLSPSQVRHVSEQEFLNIAKTGYRYSDVMSEFLSRRNKLFIIDNVGDRKLYSEQEATLWGVFLESVARNDLSVIFTSRQSAGHFGDILSSSSQSKFSYLVNGRVVAMSGVVAPPEIEEQFTREDVSRVVEEDARLGLFDDFRRRMGG